MYVGTYPSLSLLYRCYHGPLVDGLAQWLTPWSRSTKLIYAGSGEYWDWDRVWGSTPSAGNLSQYITSHSGQLNLVIPPWAGAMSTSQRAVMPWGWGVKAGMVREWVAGKTV